VFGQLELTRRCIESVVNSECKSEINLIVIDDCSLDESVPLELKRLAKEFNFLFLQNEENLGFPETCNRAFDLNPNNDVLILNSDTEVYGDWLDRMRTVAYLDSSIGTVTPLTNDGEICSYPNFVLSNSFDLEISGSELDKLAASVNAYDWYMAPTGVGFCMYFKRRCIESVGHFDSELFGKGYGEENDFCQRAIQAGWINAITPSVFVKHEAGSSFGASKKAKIYSALEVLKKTHPQYLKSVEHFIQTDPLKDARERLDIGRIKLRTSGNAVLMMTHNWGGGTERHVQELRDSLESSGVASLVCRPAEDDPDLFEIIDELTPETPNLVPLRISDPPQLFIDRLRSLGVSHVHIHNLAGYSDLIRDYIPNALSGSEITYDVTVHDYQFWCPRINLVGITGVYCGEPALGSCQACVRTLGSPFGNVSVWDWRRGYERLLRGARAIFAPSNDSARRVERHIHGLVVQVRPHEILSKKNPIGIKRKPTSSDEENSLKKEIFRIGLIGALSKEKGADVLFETAKYFARLAIPAQFVVIGFVYDHERLASMENIEVTGPYLEKELDQILTSNTLDAVWFPAVWPETYSYTLTSALKTELPIVAFDVGAISERLRNLERGFLIPLVNWGNQEIIAKTLLGAVGSKRESSYVSINSHLDQPLNKYYGLGRIE
jgi:GT2 family glycosyltransferase/glycosyltransferase involved in cell wall biosynthesis